MAYPVPPITSSPNYAVSFAIRDVQIDSADKLKDRLGYTIDEYQELFSKIPTTSEIRSKFRIESNRDVLGAILVAEGRINSNFKKPNPPKIGRTSPQKPTPRYGYTPIGNAIENRGKRFTPREKKYIMKILVDPVYNPMQQTAIGSATKLAPAVTIAKFLGAWRPYKLKSYCKSTIKGTDCT